MKTKAVLQIYVISLIVALVAGCKKDDKTPSKSPAPVVNGPYLYVGGSANNKGVYWKASLSASTVNAVADTLNTNPIYSIVTSGKDVYVAGQTAGYYKNNTFVPVTNATSIEYLALSGTTVFAAGGDNSATFSYWQGNTQINLGNTISAPLFSAPGTSTLSLSGIAASGSKVYVTGKLFYENQFGAPVNSLQGNFGTLWTNGGLQLYGPGRLVGGAFYNSTAGIAVQGNDVYVAGRMPDSTFAGGYWKNGTFNSINSGSFGPTAILSSGSDVYITGYSFVRSPGNYSQQGAYWKNGTLISFPAASSTTAIAVNGTDVYILGIDTNNNNVIWKNGSVFETLGSATTQLATCIAIGQ